VKGQLQPENRPNNRAHLDNHARVLFHTPVLMMPKMIVTCASRSQGHPSFWHANRAVGIVEETF
jgi:hypothetical protein